MTELFEDVMEEEIETAYSEVENMTFIMKYVYKDFEIVSIECVGWYWGEPNEESTKEYIGKLKAEY